MKLSDKNILEIFEKAKKKLEENNVPKKYWILDVLYKGKHYYVNLTGSPYLSSISKKLCLTTKTPTIK